MNQFTVHIYTQFKTEITGIMAETMEEAIPIAEDKLDTKHLASATWTEGPAELYAVDKILDNGEVDSANTRFFGPDELPLIDGKTTIELKQHRAELAAKFMQELLDSVETLYGIVEAHGGRTLADLMYLQQAILQDGFIDHYPNESRVVDIVRGLVSGDQWMKYIQIEEASPSKSDSEGDSATATDGDSYLLASGWQLANSYTKTVLPGAVFTRCLGGSGTKFVSYDLTILQSENGDWIPVHGMVKLNSVASPQEAADVLMNYWNNLPDADKRASISTDQIS